MFRKLPVSKTITTKLFRRAILTSCIFIYFLLPISAQMYEAENATLAGGAEKVANASSSGGFFCRTKRRKPDF